MQRTYQFKSADANCLEIVDGRKSLFLSELFMERHHLGGIGRRAAGRKDKDAGRMPAFLKYKFLYVK